MPEYYQSLEEIIAEIKDEIDYLEPLIRKRDEKDFNSYRNYEIHREIADLYREWQNLKPSRYLGLKAIENYSKAIKFIDRKLKKSYIHLDLAITAREIIKNTDDFIIAERGYRSALKASRMFKEAGHMGKYIQAESTAMDLAKHLMEVSKDEVFYGYKAREHSKICLEFFQGRNPKREKFHSINYPSILRELYKETKRPVLAALRYVHNFKLYKSNPGKNYLGLEFASYDLMQVFTLTKDLKFGIKAISAFDELRNHPKYKRKKGKVTYIMGRISDDIYETCRDQEWLTKAYEYFKEAVGMNENSSRYSLNSKYYAADVARKLFELTKKPRWKSRAINRYNSVLSISQENLEKAYRYQEDKERGKAKVHEKVENAKLYLEALSPARAV